MLLAVGLALAITPREKIADHGPRIDLEKMIPKEFGDWKVDESVIPLQSDPTQRALLNKIYNQTLSRTYVDFKGERIMLSIAYGGDQSNGMALHRPEVCYPSQGFQLLQQVDGVLNLGTRTIPVRRLIATKGQRVEPVTYWTTVGDVALVSSTIKRWEQLKLGLTGKVPDGLLFRISSLSSDYATAYQLQNGFVRDLLDAVSPASRLRLAGIPAKASSTLKP